VPRPRVNLILYHGVLAPRAAWRRDIVPAAPVVAVQEAKGATPAADARRAPNSTWAELMRRGFGFDVLACPRCRGRLRLVALIQAKPVVERILRHLGLPEAMPVARPSRAPPHELEGDVIAAAD
jgi:hypothetical protein